MRLAVFTSQFPGRVNTFFARDMRALLEAGIEIDIFPIYPLSAELWKYVPDILSDRVLPRDKIHHLRFGQSLRCVKPWPLWKFAGFLGDAATVGVSAARYGAAPMAKSAYVFPKAWAWAQQYADCYDHILAYWGNYAATCAYVFHRLIGRSIPFSTFLHAGTDLYRDQVFLRQKLLYVDNIIVVCDFNRRFLREKFPDVFDALEPKIQVYHLGLDFAEFPHQPADRPPRRVIAVGRLEKNKGFDYLLSAAKQLIGRGFDVEIELVGDGGELRPLKALAEKLDIADKVTFRGWLRFDDVRAAMRQATVLVHPSTGIGDAVPTVIKEAMALYTPVIASDVAGIPELLDEGRCGVLVPPKDVGALARAIERLLSDEQQKTTYALAGRRYAEQTFDLARNGKWLAELLRSTNRQTCRAAS